MTGERVGKAHQQVPSLERDRAWRWTAMLAGIAALQALCYWWVFVRPVSLFALYRRPLVDLHKLTETDPGLRGRLIAGYLLLGLLYWLGWRVARQASGWRAWATVCAGALVSAGLLLFAMPFGAADIFDNILHGRILGVYGANPFRNTPAQFPDDPFFYYTAWRRWPSAYGPAWELLAALISRLAGDGIITNVVAFKLVGAAFLAVCVAAVRGILLRMAPQRALAGVLLLAWNPVILVETLAEGHNDIAMIVWVLLAAWALVRRRPLAAILALVIGGLFKFIPILMLPAAGLLALRELPTRRARWRFVLLAGGLSAALILAAYAPFWQGLATLGIGRRQALWTTSLPAVAYFLATPLLGKAAAARWISLSAAGLTFIFALWQGARATREKSWLAFPQAAFNILMFYLLVTCLWFQSWYAIWPLGLAALLPPGHAARLAALFGYVALTKPLLFGPLWLWIQPLPPQAWREVRLGPAVLGLPWLYALFAWWDGQRFRRSRERNPT